MTIEIARALPEPGARGNDRKISARRWIARIQRHQASRGQNRQAVTHGLQVIQYKYLLQPETLRECDGIHGPAQVGDYPATVRHRPSHRQARAGQRHCLHLHEVLEQFSESGELPAEQGLLDSRWTRVCCYIKQSQPGVGTADIPGQDGAYTHFIRPISKRRHSSGWVG